MDTDTTAGERRAAIREGVGVILICVGVAGGLCTLLALGGLNVFFTALAAVTVTSLGYRLARGTETGTPGGTPGETDQDYEPVGPGPLYQDPDDPQAFIPQR